MKKIFFGLAPITLLAAVSLAILAATFDPFKSDFLVKFLFFASMTTFIWGCGAIVFFILNFFSNDRPTDALRRGLFLSLMALSWVFLKKQGILHWSTVFVAMTIIMVIEIWIYKRSKMSVDYRDDL